MTDPAYKRKPGESWEDYRKRIESMTPPDFENKTQIDGRKPNSK
jgi:hypothetical protein